jgi:hypothetical protein
MTDSDNTRTQVSAIYGDIELADKKKNKAASQASTKTNSTTNK